MGLVLPTRGAPGSGAWGDTIDANYVREDAHDHTIGKGLPITSAALNVNADIPFSSLYAPTQLHRVQFSSVTALSSGAQNKSIFVNSSDNELYWRSNAGNNVKLTAGSALNVAAFAGGIGGDYVSVGAVEAFDDANKRYTFKDGAGNWARIAAGELRAYPTGGTTAFYVGHAAPGGMAASYTLTYPTAVPGSTVLAQVDNTGAVTFSNTVVNDATMAVNKNVILSGTGLVKHGTKTLSIPGSAFQAGSGVAFSYGSSGLIWNGADATAPIVLPVGARILAVRLYIIDSATGPTKLRNDFNSLTSTGSGVGIASSSVSSGAGTQQTLTNSGLTTVVASTTSYFIVATRTTGAASVEVFMAEVDYDQP
jgi:hypothetical protein